MIVGTYIDGRSLGYDESLYRFSVGTVPVSFQDVRAFDAAGQITWLTDELMVWFRSIDANAFALAAAQADAQYYAPRPGDVRAGSPQVIASQRQSNTSTTTVVVTVVAVLLLVVSMVVTVFFATRLVSTVETDGPYFETLLEEDDYGYGYGYGYGGDDPYGYGLDDQTSAFVPGFLTSRS